ncbi:hypothetical protein [Burkholderia sp. Ac-20365]|jgi:hypothetical protein|uniref:hypothetical protein n=1 Tax=Burkholderia sp. Ac-20365 TaxID=2703897 RepID=UPI00197B1F79|nr:hypothetical protein [Burkholderia sp. Ac-20365]MBN3763622.1 hypothetical protein [Burkholderia sp. Ac-20365]
MHATPDATAISFFISSPDSFFFWNQPNRREHATHGKPSYAVQLIKFVELIASLALLRGETTGFAGGARFRFVEKWKETERVQRLAASAKRQR